MTKKQAVWDSKTGIPRIVIRFDPRAVLVPFSRASRRFLPLYPSVFFFFLIQVFHHTRHVVSCSAFLGPQPSPAELISFTVCFFSFLYFSCRRKRRGGTWWTARRVTWRRMASLSNRYIFVWAQYADFVARFVSLSGGGDGRDGALSH